MSPSSSSEHPEPPEPPEPPQAREAPDPPLATDPPEEPDGRSRLVAALRPRATRSQLAAGALCLLLGLGLVTTVRDQDATDLSTLRQSDLITLLERTSTRADRLQAEAAELVRTREELRAASGDSRAAREVARERLDVLEVLAGTAPASGPGIALTLSGAGADAELLLSAVQELRDAGAEAISLGDVRVVATTYVVADPDDPASAATPPGDLAAEASSVIVDATVVSAPFEFTAIGDPATLASAMSFPGGVLPTVSARGGTGEVEQLDEVEISVVADAAPPAVMSPQDPDPEGDERP